METHIEGKAQWIVVTMEEMWAEVARGFEKICGKSLQRGDVK